MMLKKLFNPWMASKEYFPKKKISPFPTCVCFLRSIDNSRVGVTFARKRTIGGRRGGSYSNGGDRYSRGDHDSSRYRRRYSPRSSDDR